VIRAVTFDFWNTLVAEDHDGTPEEVGTMREAQISGWERVLSAAGSPVERAAISAAFDESWEVFHERWHANEPYGPVEATALMCDALGVDPAPSVRAALEAVFDEVGRVAPLRLAPGAEGCLRALGADGVRLGIVCDVGMTPSNVLRERLDRFGVLRYFDHWSFSDETGCFKPFAPAFRHALQGLGVDDPAAAAHVGDARRTDMAGALALGMTAVRYRHFHEAPAETGPEGDLVIDDLAELPAALGLGT